MKAKQFTLIIVSAFVIFVLSCGSTPGRGDQSSSPREASRANVKWDNDPNGYLYLNNNVKQPLILFAGAVNNNNILGGIRAESNRRIDFFNAVQENSGSFLLRAISEDVYRAKGSGISSDDVVYAQIITYDKKQPRVIQKNIDMRLGGQAYVIIENHTRMALEVALNSPDAETLTALAPNEVNKKVYLEPNIDGYVFYPIFKYYDKTNDVVQSVEPDRGVARRMNPTIPSPSVSTSVIRFDNSNISNLTFRFATVILRNEAIEAVYLLEGSSRIMNQNGTNVVNPGNETYNIYLGDRPQRRSYSIDYAGRDYPVPSFEYRPGNTYLITFRRDGRAEVEDLGAFDLKDLSISLLNQR